MVLLIYVPIVVVSIQVAITGYCQNLTYRTYNILNPMKSLGLMDLAYHVNTNYSQDKKKHELYTYISQETDRLNRVWHLHHAGVTC